MNGGEHLLFAVRIHGLFESLLAAESWDHAYQLLVQEDEEGSLYPDLRRYAQARLERAEDPARLQGRV